MIAIVPQLVPVANDVAEATRKTIAGKICGGTLSLSKFVRYWSVWRLSQQFFSAHAKTRIMHGRKLFLQAITMHFQVSGIRSVREMVAHKNASIRLNRDAKIRISMLFSVLPMT